MQEDTLKEAFLPYGIVENIKLIKEKGGEQMARPIAHVGGGQGRSPV